MRKNNKNQCAELIRTLEEAHGEIAKYIEKRDIQTASALLGECQDAAVAIGGIIEDSEGEGTEAVSRLEEYCELVYQINSEIVSRQAANPKKVLKRLRKSILGARNSINTLPTRLEAVFLPYKASMWDSLESIWLAADEDENCDAYVIPIPYYDKNPDGSFAKLHYEADQYPDYVPVVNYGQYNLEERHPDMIFIHNPYDGYNYVTSVHPAFYSDKLKEHTDCLVYVPYFATSGVMGDGTKFIPSYLNMDYIVVQSKDMIDQYDKRIPREKFLPLGSPKFDRVIRLCKSPPEPPADWKEKMEGKRVYFYNTSIAGMLDNTGKFLQKMAYVFNTFKEVDDACILWRPHPLLASTFDSMRPSYKFVYELLIKAFVEENIGILDETPDIEIPVVFSDAYIGDEKSSVVSLFEVANKPLFILDANLTERPPADFWKAWYFQTLRWDGQNKYCIFHGKYLYETDVTGDRYDYHFVRSLTDETEEGQYMRAIRVAGKTFVCPSKKEDVIVFEEDGSEHKIKLRHWDTDELRFAIYQIYDKYIILYPYGYPDAVKIDAVTERVDYIEGIRDYSSECQDGQREFSSRSMYLNGQFEGKLVFLNMEGTRIKAVDIKSLEVEERQVSFHRRVVNIVGADYDGDILWGIPRRGTVVTRWNVKTDEYTDFDLAIEGLQSISQPDKEIVEVGYFGGKPFYHGKNIVFGPAWGNKFVELNPQSGEAKEWIPPFDISLENRDAYFLNWGIGNFSLMYETGERYFFYAPLRKNYVLDVDNHSYKEVEIRFRKDEVLSFARGFATDDEGKHYSCAEDPINSLYSYISGEFYGPRYDPEVQKKSTRWINASDAGDCGSKVYEILAGDAG